MKTLLTIVLILSLILLFTASAGIASAQEIQEINISTENKVHLHIFYGQGCPHCAKLRLFIDSIKDDYPSLIVYEHEVYHDNEKRELFSIIAQKYGKEISGVPTVFIDDNMIMSIL